MHASPAETAIIKYSEVGIEDLAHIAQISDLHQRAVDNLTDTASMIAGIEEDLRAKITAARKNLDAAETALAAAGSWINPCGVLQPTATEIDMLAARRHDAYARLRAACRTVAALPAPPETN